MPEALHMEHTEPDDKVDIDETCVDVDMEIDEVRRSAVS